MIYCVILQSLHTWLPYVRGIVVYSHPFLQVRQKAPMADCTICYWGEVGVWVATYSARIKSLMISLLVIIPFRVRHSVLLLKVKLPLEICFCAALFKSSSHALSNLFSMVLSESPLRVRRDVNTCSSN